MDGIGEVEFLHKDCLVLGSGVKCVEMNLLLYGCDRMVKRLCLEKRKMRGLFLVDIFGISMYASSPPNYVQ